MNFSDKSSKIDVEDKGSVDSQTVIKACQTTERGTSYDTVRAALKDCNLDSTGRVELDDYVEVSLHPQCCTARSAGSKR